MSKIKLNGLLFTALLLALIEFFKAFGILDILNPGSLYLLVIIYSALSGGVKTGLVSATLCLIYDFLLLYGIPFSGNFTSEQEVRITLLAGSGLFSAIIMGKLKLKLQDSIKEKIGQLLERLNVKDREHEDVLKRLANRQEFLARAKEIVFSSLDYKTTLTGVVKSTVSGFADWATLDMLNASGVLERIAVAHRDEAKSALMQELNKEYFINSVYLMSPLKVLKTGRTEYYPKITDEMLVRGAKDQRHLEIMRQIGLVSVIIAPLFILGKPVGVITFVAAESKVSFDKEDLFMAQDLARQASVAVKNSLLYRQAQDLARKEHSQNVVLESLLKTAPVGFAFIGSNCEYLKVNGELAKNIGADPATVVGRKLDEVEFLVNLGVAHEVRYVMQTKQVIVNEEVSGFLPHISNKLHHWLISYFPVFGENEEMMGVGVVVDEITRRKKAEEETTYYASHDVLTGLPNRKVFEEKLNLALDNAKGANVKLAVMFLDLDRFKNINDTLGHGVGDQIMVEVAKRLKSILREEDLVARWGGDEFVIFINDVRGNFEVVRVAVKILKLFEEAVRIEDHSLHIGASIGISLFPNDGTTMQSLLKNSDTALYGAKEAGRNRYQFYNEAMNFEASERLVMENELRLALEKNELRVYYQPIVDLKTMRTMGMEALVRWQHPSRGIIKPNQFIGMAEESGIIVPLGRWVLSESCKQTRAWHAAGFTNLVLSVNFSARQFLEEDLVESIKEALNECGLDPCFLELEITESVAMENVDRTRHKLNELNNLGVKIIIDDFGTGYSSLSYLKSFPVSKLKIDKSFVRHAITREQDSKIIRAIISMAESLNLKVIAEGVDTETQLGLLAAMGCNAAQGYFISKPLAKDDFMTWMLEQKNPGPPPLPAALSSGSAAEPSEGPENLDI